MCACVRVYVVHSILDLSIFKLELGPHGWFFSGERTGNFALRHTATITMRYFSANCVLIRNFLIINCLKDSRSG